MKKEMQTRFIRHSQIIRVTHDLDEKGPRILRRPPSAFHDRQFEFHLNEFQLGEKGLCTVLTFPDFTNMWEEVDGLIFAQWIFTAY